MRAAEVTIGRNSPSVSVDVDVAVEGGPPVGAGCCAMVRLCCDGQFVVENVGSNSLKVNGTAVGKGATAMLPHQALLRVDGATFLFCVNHAMVGRLMKKARERVA